LKFAGNHCGSNERQFDVPLEKPLQYIVCVRNRREEEQVEGVRRMQLQLQHLHPFPSVANTNDILQRLLKGDVELAFITPTMITSEFQIMVAATKALGDFKNGTLLTRNVHSELVLNLSAERNIAASIRKFGLNVKEPNLIVAAFNPSEEKLELIKELIKGKEVLGEQSIGAFFEEEKATKHYDISKEEIAVSSLENAIVSRIALRGI